MKQKFLYIMICVSACLASCSDEDKLTPTETPELGYSVPQGNHDYDARIVDWNERCNTFILYQFRPKEIYWTVNGWQESVENPNSTEYPYVNGYLYEVADENYIGQQLELIEKSFLNLYQDSTLTRCLPLKLLLCANLQYRYMEGNTVQRNVYSGYNCFAYSWGNVEVQNMTAEQKAAFKSEANTVFLQRLLDNGKVILTNDFYEGVDYTGSITERNMYSRGFLVSGTSFSTDAANYLRAIVSTSYEDLTADVPASNTSFRGILNPTKDVNGLIRKRYDILVNHMKAEYGIDLQAIGNTVID